MKKQTPSRAVALTYDGERAPFISAKGDVELAAEILRIAQEYEIPVYENPDLVNILAELELGDEIPELLYRTIAEIIAFVYNLKGKTPDGSRAQNNNNKSQQEGKQESQQKSQTPLQLPALPYSASDPTQQDEVPDNDK